MGVNFRAVGAIIKKEFMDNLRNKWIIVISIVFLICVILTSIIGGAGDVGNLTLTVAVLSGINSYTIPLLAVILGYGTIAAEAESGALTVVMANPIRRVEILAGKFVGLAMVIVVPVVIGLGTGGIIVMVMAGTEAWAAYLAFMGFTILLGWVFLSLSMCVSALSKRSSTAIGWGVILVLWDMLYGFVSFGALAASGSLTLEGGFTVPDWYYAFAFGSPVDLVTNSIMLSFGLSFSLDIGGAIPGFINLGTHVAAILWWLILPMLFAYLAFQKRDI